MGMFECIDMHACIRVFVHVFVYVEMYICKYVCVCSMSMNVCACMDVSVCVYVCVLITCTQCIFSLPYVCGKCAVPLQL